MQWSKWSIDLLAPDKLPAGATHFLGYNEPNHNQQARLSPQEAAVSWPNAEVILWGRLLEYRSVAETAQASTGMLASW